jgi:class 3 adenylate cyclase
VRLGIAIHAGETVRQGQSYVGSAVALASRLAHVAAAGQVLLTDTIYGLLRSADVPPMRDLGVWGPHGIGQPVHVYEAVVPGRQMSAAAAESPRRLLAVLFTDIAASTDRAIKAGDREWGVLVQRHHAAVRREVQRNHGVEVDTAGDGFFVTFDSPSAAVRSAIAIRGAVRELGLELRQGIHVGECELIAGKVGGVAVVVAARTREASAPGSILVTQTVRDTVAGGGFAFVPSGTRHLKGIPGRWRLFAVDDSIGS